MKQTITLLNGSPRRRSTSGSIIDHLVESLSDDFDIRCHRAGDDTGELIDSIDGSHLLIVVSPLYWDSIPSDLLNTFKSISETDLEGKGMIAIINCGFPEAYQADTAIEICRNMAIKSGMEWKGGLTIGGGGSIDGRPLSTYGPERNAVRALDLMCESIIKGEGLTSEAEGLAALPFFPTTLYIIAANHHWRRLARKNGIKRGLRARPYDGEESRD